MKKSILVVACGAMFFCSCGETSSLQSGVDLEELTQQYELIEAAVEEVGKEGDDISPKVETQEDASVIETSAREYVTELMNRIAIAKEKVMRSGYSTTAGVVGVFKVGSCGSYKELIIHMDCEDNRDGSYVSGDVGDTSVDSNGNVDFRFCLTESNRFYPGGVLLVDQVDGSTVNSYWIFVRRHDTEDSKGSNSVYGNHAQYNSDVAISNGFTKLSRDNAIMAWGFPTSNSYYPYPPYGFGPSGINYGLLLVDFASTGIIYCDDEDSKNGNWAQKYTKSVFERDVRDYIPEFGAIVNANTTYRVGVSTNIEKFRYGNFYYDYY